MSSTTTRLDEVAQRLSAMSEQEAAEALHRCCASRMWAAGVLERRPFSGGAALMDAARAVWSAATREDIMEAVSEHPRIGADLDRLREKFADSAAWSSQEQAGMAAASEDELVALRDGNLRYEAKFGHIFIVCATGKSPAEMLAILESRMPNGHDDELAVVAGEIAKITHIRLEKL